MERSVAILDKAESEELNTGITPLFGVKIYKFNFKQFSVLSLKIKASLSSSEYASMTTVMLNSEEHNKVENIYSKRSKRVHLKSSAVVLFHKSYASFQHDRV